MRIVKKIWIRANLKSCIIVPCGHGKLGWNEFNKQLSGVNSDDTGGNTGKGTVTNTTPHTNDQLKKGKVR